jgi:hypothetical protein
VRTSIQISPGQSIMDDATVLNGELYLTALAGANYVLFKTDGSTYTRLLSDSGSIGIGSSGGFYGSAAGNRERNGLVTSSHVYFYFKNTGTETRLFRTDGSTIQQVSNLDGGYELVGTA